MDSIVVASTQGARIVGWPGATGVPDEPAAERASRGGIDVQHIHTQAHGVGRDGGALRAARAASGDAGAGRSARVRVLHGSGDAPAVDVYAGKNAVVEGLEFGTITDYLTVPAGEYRIRVVPAGATLKEGPAVIDAALTFEGGTATTVAATGSLEEGIIPQVLLDEPSPSVDMAQARVVHFAYDAPAVDIAPVGGDPIITDLAFPDDSGYADLPPGTYTLEVRAAGSPDAVVTLDPLTLAAGTSSSAFAVGSLEAGTFTVVPALDASIPTTAQLRVLHGSPDAPPVDIVVNGVRVFGNLPFGANSPYLTVPVGDNEIRVIASGAAVDGPAVIEATLPFEGDTRTTVVASNVLDSIEANVIADKTRVKAKQAQIRVGHLSADAPNVDIAADGSAAKDALLKDVPYQTVSDYLTVAPGDLDLDVREPGKKAVIADLPALPLEKGTNYSAYAIGSPADGSFQVVLLVDAAGRVVDLA